MLEGLRKELEEIDCTNPDVVEILTQMDRRELEPGDEFVGLADDQAIRLNIMITQMNQQALQMLRDHFATHHGPQETHDIEACKAIHEIVNEQIKKIVLLEELAENILRLDHGLSITDSVDLRKGRQVVKTKPRPRSMGAAMIISVNSSGDMEDELFTILTGQNPGHHGGCSGCNCH